MINFFGKESAMDYLAELFSEVQTRCKNSNIISEIGYKKWIEVLKITRLENGKVYIKAQNKLNKKVVEEMYLDLIKDAFDQTMGFGVEIIIEYDDFQAESDNAKTADSSFNSSQENSSNTNNPEYPDYYDDKNLPDMSSKGLSPSSLTFESFVKGESNELALAFCKNVAGYQGSSNQQKYNPVIIYGNSGLGKTHLLRAIQNEILANQKDKMVIYTTGEKFTNEMVDSIKDNTASEFRQKYRNCDFLLIDDIHFIAGKEGVQEEFFNTFNILYDAGKQIVLTTDISPSKIALLQDRIKSRLEWGVQADIDPPNFETRLAIVKRKAEQLKVILSDKVAIYIAENLKTNVRQLEGAVNKIHAITAFTNEKPSMSMAQKVVKETIIEEQPTKVTANNIIEEVAHRYKITSEEIKSKSRKPTISLARKIAIMLMYDMLQMTFTQIGNILGKDHSTMNIHYKEITSAVAANGDLRENVDYIKKNLRSR